MRFGGLTAVDTLSFAARTGEITAVIGPNGAGKTTVFNCITGFYRPTSGRLALSHAGGTFALENMPGHRIARRALALWRAAASGNCPRHVHRPRVAVPGRARRWPQPARERGTVRAAAKN